MAVEEKLSTLSYARGANHPLLELTIGDLLTRTASRYPDNLGVASCHQGKRLTWAQLMRRLTRCARPLGAGCRKGDRVGIWSTNCIEWIMMHMGAARAGVALVNVNPPIARTSRLHAEALADEGDVSVAQRQARRLRRDPRPRLLRAAARAQAHIYFDTPEWEQFLDAESRLPDRVDVEDIANIQYTSGTTGHAKGVMLTHHNVVNDGQFLAQGFITPRSTKIVVPVAAVSLLRLQ